MRFVRAGFAVLAVGQLVPGVWALIDPVHFYAAFPGLGSGWVAADGPLNHHLIVDAGAGLAATGAVLAVATVSSSRAVHALALVAYLVHAVPHLLYHAGHPPVALGPVEQTLTWAPLAAGVLLAVGMPMWVAGRRPDAPPPPAETTDGGRVPGIDGPPRNVLLRAGFAVARRRLGTVPAAWRITARVPRVALARLAADAAHRRTRLVPDHVGALATLRAATVVACPFCVDILAAAASEQGVRGEQVRELSRWRDSSAFDHDERLALTLADAMTATPTEVSDALVAALVDRFGVDGTVELAAAVGHENARARANRVFGVPPQGFAASSSCPVPEVTAS